VSAGGFISKVTEGLIYELDGDNLLSYSSGFTGRNIAKPSETFSLVNGAGYDGESFYTDGVDDYINLGAGASHSMYALGGVGKDYTMTVVARNPSGTLITSTGCGAGQIAFTLAFITGGYLRYVTKRFGESDLVIDSVSNLLSVKGIGVDEYFSVTITKKGADYCMYFNDELLNTGTATTDGIQNIGNGVTLGARPFRCGQLYYSNEFRLVRVYNRELSLAEITENSKILNSRES
jgi:hypothetical protein